MGVPSFLCRRAARYGRGERRGGGGGGDGGEDGGGGGEFRPTRFTERRNGSERTRNQRRGPREQRAPRDLRARTVSLLPVPWICFFFIPFSLSFSFLLSQRFFSCFGLLSIHNCRNGAFNFLPLLLERIANKIGE